MSRRGFTIIELIISITVLAILLTLSVVNVRSSQIKARDSERTADVENIARALETSIIIDGSAVAPGNYPSTGVINQYLSTDTIHSLLPDIDIASVQAPGVTNENTISLQRATSGGTLSPVLNTYLYQPFSSGTTLCTTGSSCRSFNIYYRLESDNSIQIVKSKQR